MAAHIILTSNEYARTLLYALQGYGLAGLEHPAAVRNKSFFQKFKIMGGGGFLWKEINLMESFLICKYL